MPYYTKEQQELAKQMDLFTYLKNYEPNELVQESRTQYCTREHDSLKISNGIWYLCSKKNWKNLNRELMKEKTKMVGGKLNNINRNL